MVRDRNVFFRCRQIPFSTGAWSWDPRDRKCFPLKLGFRYTQLPFKTGFTVFGEVCELKRRHNNTVNNSYMRIYIRTYIHTHIYTYIHKYIHTYPPTYLLTYLLCTFCRQHMSIIMNKEWVSCFQFLKMYQKCWKFSRRIKSTGCVRRLALDVHTTNKYGV